MKELKAAIEEMRERCNAASEGPWGVDAGLKYTTGKTCHWQHVMGVRGKAICNTSAFEEVRIGDELISAGRNGEMGDARFIAAARTDLPRVLAALSILVDALDFHTGTCVTADGQRTSAAHALSKALAALKAQESPSTEGKDEK